MNTRQSLPKITFYGVATTGCHVSERLQMRKMRVFRLATQSHIPQVGKRAESLCLQLRRNIKLCVS